MGRGGGALPFSLSFAHGTGRLTLVDHARFDVFIRRLELEITGLTFPFDLTGGPVRLRDRWLTATELEVGIDLRVARHGVATLPGEREGLSHLALGIDRGAFEVVGRVPGGTRGCWFVVRYDHDVVDERDLVLRPSLFAMLGPPVASFPQVAVALARLASDRFERRGLDLIARDVPRRVLKRTLVQEGYRLPDCRRLRLGSVRLGSAALVLSFSARTVPPDAAAGAAMALNEVEALSAPGDESVAAGDLAAARRHYLAALRMEPDHPALVSRLAWLDAADPARREAARAACLRLADTSDDPGAQALMASLDLASGDVDPAIERFEELASRLGPLGRSRVMLLLGKLKAPAGASPAAVLLESAIGLDPLLVEALEALRDCYAAGGMLEQLEWVGERLVAAHDRPEDRGRVLVELGRTYHERFGDVDRAARHYEQALLHSPEAHAALFGLAECKAARGDHRTALRCLDAVVRIAADRGDRQLEALAHVRAGERWQEMGDLTSAATRFHRAVASDPASKLALERAAGADVTLGRMEKAAEGYRQLAALAEGEDEELWRSTLLGLARLYLDRLRVPEAALAALDRVLAASPDDETALALRAQASGAARVTCDPMPRAPRPEAPASPAELDALIVAHLDTPGDEELADRVSERLDEAGDWPRLVAVLAARAEAATDAALRADLLVRVADVLARELGDAESAAESLLRAAELVDPSRGEALARHAARLLRDAGLEAAARDADAIADRIARS